MHNPGRSHWSLVKRVLKYLVGTVTLRLCLGGASLSSGIFESAARSPMQRKLPFYGLYDSDWAGDKDNARSTSGYCFFWSNALISWSSKLQATISSSSTMAEYVSAYHTTAESLWLREVTIRSIPDEEEFTDNDSNSGLDSMIDLIGHASDSGYDSTDDQRIEYAHNVNDLQLFDPF
jgi:hypothetical protein